MMKLRYIFALLLLTSCIFSLFQIKFKVQNLHREAMDLRKELEHEKDNIHVLKAEWAYLNQPERLQRLSQKFLDLHEIKPEQLLPAQAGLMITPIHNNIIPEPNNQNIIKVSYNSPVKKVKWNYRARPVIKTRPKR